MKRPDLDRFPWLMQEWADESQNNEIDARNTAKYKAEALSDGFARCFTIIHDQLKFVSAVPDLPNERTETFCSGLKELSSSSEAETAEFMQKTIKTSFAFSNDCGMNASVQALHRMPAKKLAAEKLRVAIVVGQGNFESMTPEILNHAHMVLFVDIDKNVLEHNLFMARLLQSQEDFEKTYLDKTKNPLLIHHVKQGSVTAYNSEKKQMAHYENTEYTDEYLAATLFNKGTITFAQFSILGTKLRMYIQGEKTTPQGKPLFENNDLNDFKRLEAVMLADPECANFVPMFKKLYQGVENWVKKKGKVITIEEAEGLKLIVDTVVDNRYFMAKDTRFDVCRAASRELKFASVQLNLFDQAQVSKLKAVFDANNLVVTFANVTNLFYYDNEKPFLPTARADQPWEAKGNLIKSLKSLCDPVNTIYFYSIYEHPGSQLLSSQCCEGLINYAGAVTRNLKELNSKMVGTQAMAKIREEQHQRDQKILNSDSSDHIPSSHSK